MGKKSKYGNPATQWIDSMKGKNRDLEERFGIDRVSFGGKPGTSQQRESFQDMQSYNERITDAARNDYDLRRTIEAAALSGKKKAQDILDRGFNSIDDVRKAQNFSEKAAKRHGQGGSFSDNSDYMGLTRSMVNRDRRMQNEKFVTTEEFDDYKKNLEANSPNETEGLKEIVLSEHMQKAKDRVDDWEGGNPPYPIYNEGIRAQAQGDAASQLSRDIDIANLTDPMYFLENKKREVIEGENFQPVF